MAAFATTAFFEKTYHEALTLARDAQRYFADEVAHGRDESQVDDASGELEVTVAGMRLVARVMHIVAWLLEQKAIGAGELDEREVQRRSEPLLEVLVSIGDEGTGRSYPKPLLALIERSRRLYARVARLDEMMRGTVH
ncbi:MAG: DUF1465 family protein [Alphaproteobacteria bacterium]